jgi:hypothetical protein
MDDQSEALQLADALDDGENFYAESSLWYDQKLSNAVAAAAAELRRLVAENERLHEMNQELTKAYNKMRNSAAGYSNFCDDNANTRRCERDYVAAEYLYRAAIAKAEGEQK